MSLSQWVVVGRDSLKCWRASLRQEQKLRREDDSVGEGRGHMSTQPSNGMRGEGSPGGAESHVSNGSSLLSSKKAWLLV